MDLNLETVALEDCGGPDRVDLREAPIRGEHLVGAVLEVGPGKDGWPYHWEAVQEEWLLVLAGEPTVRTPEGERTLSPGELTCFPVGPEGAHTFRNATDEPVRVLMWSNATDVNVVHYPDDDRVAWGTRWSEGSARPGDHVPYWGER